MMERNKDVDIRSTPCSTAVMCAEKTEATECVSLPDDLNIHAGEPTCCCRHHRHRKLAGEAAVRLSTSSFKGEWGNPFSTIGFPTISTTGLSKITEDNAPCVVNGAAPVTFVWPTLRRFVSDNERCVLSSTTALAERSSEELWKRGVELPTSLLTDFVCDPSLQKQQPKKSHVSEGNDGLSIGLPFSNFGYEGGSRFSRRIDDNDAVADTSGAGDGENPFGFFCFAFPSSPKHMRLLVVSLLEQLPLESLRSRYFHAWWRFVLQKRQSHCSGGPLVAEPASSFVVTSPSLCVSPGKSPGPFCTTQGLVEAVPREMSWLVPANDELSCTPAISACAGPLSDVVLCPACRRHWTSRGSWSGSTSDMDARSQRSSTYAAWAASDGLPERFAQKQPCRITPLFRSAATTSSTSGSGKSLPQGLSKHFASKGLCFGSDILEREAAVRRATEWEELTVRRKIQSNANRVLDKILMLALCGGRPTLFPALMRVDSGEWSEQADAVWIAAESQSEGTQAPLPLECHAVQLHPLPSPRERAPEEDGGASRSGEAKTAQEQQDTQWQCLEKGNEQENANAAARMDSCQVSSAAGMGGMSGAFTSDSLPVGDDAISVRGNRVALRNDDSYYGDKNDDDDDDEEEEEDAGCGSDYNGNNSCCCCCCCSFFGAGKEGAVIAGDSQGIFSFPDTDISPLREDASHKSRSRNESNARHDDCDATEKSVYEWFLSRQLNSLQLHELLERERERRCRTVKRYRRGLERIIYVCFGDPTAATSTFSSINPTTFHTVGEVERQH